MGNKLGRFTPEAAFASYAEGRDFISGDGYGRLFADAGVDMGSPAALYFVHLTGAESIGRFSRSDFQLLFERLGSKSLEELRRDVRAGYERVMGDKASKDFADFHAACFGLSRETPAASTVSGELAVVILEQLMGELKLAKPLLAFVARERGPESPVKAVTRDEWNLMLSFCLSYDAVPTMDEFSQADAWPVLLDDFVEHENGS